jgi:hypothetical protein
MKAVAAVRDGVIVPQNVPDARRVLIDEAQDVRELYVELLTILNLCAPMVTTMVVGDRMQMIYDFDTDFPATEETLLYPDTAFANSGQWEKITLTQSFRLTHQMASLAHSLFCIDVYSARDGKPIEVRSGNTFRLFDILEDVLMDAGSETNTMILVDKKKSNRPLCILLNAMSQRGKTVHLHGVDSEDTATTTGKLRCSTWWAAKGMQIDTAIVIVPRFAPLNPLYVALTRAFRRLIVIIDEKEPNYALCRSIFALTDGTVDMSQTTRSLIHRTASGNVEDSFDTTLGHGNNSTGEIRLRNLDSWRAPRDMVHSFKCESVRNEPFGIDTENATSLVYINGRFEDAQKAAFRTALVCAEFHATGRIRSMNDILFPTKLDPAAYCNAVRFGLASRYISAKRPANDILLAKDLHTAAEHAYYRIKDTIGGHDQPAIEDFAEIALATLAWDSYDHVMRQLRPVTQWCHRPEVLRGIEYARTLLPSAHTPGVDYDIQSRMLHENQVFTARTHANSDEAAYYVSWGEEHDAPSHETTTQSAVRAAMHPHHTCMMVDIMSGWVKRIHVPSPRAIVSLVEK